MNILMLGNAYPPMYMGGESAHLYNLASSLRKRGHRIFVAHPAASTDGRTRIRLSRSDDGVEVYRLFLPRDNHTIDRLNLILLDVFQNLCKEGNEIDIIHCHSNKFVQSIDVLTQKRSVPLVTTVHAVHKAMTYDLIQKKDARSDPKELVRYTADTKRHQSICVMSDKIIAISKAMEGLIIKYFGAETFMLEFRRIRKLHALIPG